MNGRSILVTTLVMVAATAARAQNPAEKSGSVPLYQVTVIARTVSAVDYQYRTGPTRIDFRGTVLLPDARGEATVESKRGRTEVEAKFDHVPAPTRFGREYLTYVLWAISPEGHAKNLGEVLPGGSDKAKMRVTTDLQAFGLIVTAEPYSAVRQPSDVVVIENVIRPDTLGKIEPVQARYELLPRGHYTYEKPKDLQTITPNAPKLSQDQYEAVLEVYQAQNAVQIANSVGAAQYAPDIFAKAQQLLQQAQNLQSTKAASNTIVTMARQAAQTAEDARTVALKRKQDAELEEAKAKAAAAEQQRAEAQAALSQAQSEAAAARARQEQQSSARGPADQTTTVPQEAPPTMIDRPQRLQSEPGATGQQPNVRLRMLQQLNTVLETRDTPRGLVVTIPDTYFHSTTLTPSVYGKLANIASILRSQPGLTVAVEGHTDDRGDAAYNERMSYQRASTVRDILARQGVDRNALSARGLGNTRPVASNATPSGREQNRRVEITVSGGPIGNMASWERSYSLAPGK